jgi:hypothetical protein
VRRYSPEFPYDEYGAGEETLSPHLGYSRQDSGYSHHDAGVGGGGYPSDAGGGYDPGYSTDHGYVSDPLPFGDGYGRGGSLGGGGGPFSGGGGGHQNETQALVALDKAYNKPVAFSVRTNVMYDGTLDDDSPVHGSAVR